MMGYYTGFGWGMGAFGYLWMLIFWGALIWFIVWLLNQSGKKQQERKDTQEILKERFAMGEISKKEFQEMKTELRE